jgi:DNA-binding CsgD family transcriptional regulator
MSCGGPPAPARISRLRLVAGGDRLLVSIQPLRAPDGGRALALVVLGRRHACSDLGIEMLAVCCGLTLAERRVLSALVRAMPPREIASAYSIAVSTVRTHISSIRGKLDARSIDSLLLRVAEMPPVASALYAAGGAVRSVCRRPQGLPLAA